MKIAIALSAVLLAVPALAEVSTAISSVRTRIVCSTDEVVRITDADGQTREEVSTGKSSESIRTSWVVDNVEYRSSEWTGYRDSDAAQEGRTLAKVTTEKRGNYLVETSEVQIFRNYVGRFASNGFQERRSTTETYYKVEGNRRTIVKSTVNGQEDMDSVGATEVETILSATSRSVLVTYPSTTFVHNGSRYDTIKSEMTCIYERLF